MDLQKAQQSHMINNFDQQIMGCLLPEQTANYAVCLNDDVIMEGVPVINNNRLQLCTDVDNPHNNSGIFNLPTSSSYYQINKFDKYYQKLIQEKYKNDMVNLNNNKNNFMLMD